MGLDIQLVLCCVTDEQAATRMSSPGRQFYFVWKRRRNDFLRYHLLFEAARWTEGDVTTILKEIEDFARHDGTEQDVRNQCSY